MATVRIDIKPSMLRWAVERSGRDSDLYAGEDENYAKWLRGDCKPTYRMAEDFAHKFHVPFGYLLLNEPPKEVSPITFFRKQTRSEQSINVYDQVNDLIDRQDWLSNYLRENGYDKVPFAGIADARTDEEHLSKMILEQLDLSADWAFRHKKVDMALKHLTTLMEDRGVIVVFSNMVGNSTRRLINVDECRGICLYDEYAPFIFINSHDAKSAQIFTLMHEFAHILTGYTSGISDDQDDLLHSSMLERTCDKAAALALVSKDLMEAQWKLAPYKYDELAMKFKVSRYVIARRACELGYITLKQQFSKFEEWKAEKPEDKRTSGRADFYATAVRRYSKVFLTHVCNALDSGKLMYTEAFRMLGIKGSTFDGLMKSKAFLG